MTFLRSQRLSTTHPGGRKDSTSMAEVASAHDYSYNHRPFLTHRAGQSGTKLKYPDLKFLNTCIRLARIQLSSGDSARYDSPRPAQPGHNNKLRFHSDMRRLAAKCTQRLTVSSGPSLVALMVTTCLTLSSLPASRFTRGFTKFVLDPLHRAGHTLHPSSVLRITACGEANASSSAARAMAALTTSPGPSVCQPRAPRHFVLTLTATPL